LDGRRSQSADIHVRIKSQQREIASKHVVRRLPVAQPQMRHAATRDRGLAEVLHGVRGRRFAVLDDEGRICIEISNVKAAAAKLAGVVS
jgi:hypothetical protein